MTIRQLKVLDASRRSDYKEWLDAWRAWPQREVMAHPDYVRLFARPVDRSLCVVETGGRTRVLLPLIARPLKAETWAGHSKSWGAVTPYGYGGAFLCADEVVDAAAFGEAFQEVERSLQLVSLFVRFSLFSEQVVGYPFEQVTVAGNVVVPLAAPEVMWTKYAHKVRKNVKRARANGVMVEVDSEGRRLGEFHRIYASTMERRNADGAYRFSAAFFGELLEKLSGSVVLFHAVSEGRVISTELVLVSERRLYSFLGGTDAGYFELRPNDLLKHEVCAWGYGEGKEHFVLGGGYCSEDGIFQYKKSFAPDGVVPFVVGRRVSDRMAYDALVVARREYEASRGDSWVPREEFFPAYRS